MKKRRVEYSVWTGHEDCGETWVGDMIVVECLTQEEASDLATHHARQCDKQGRRYEKTVYVYTSKGTDWRYGFFVCKTLKPQPYCFVNFNSIQDLDSKKPIQNPFRRADSIDSDSLAPLGTKSSK